MAILCAKKPDTIRTPSGRYGVVEYLLRIKWQAAVGITGETVHATSRLTLSKQTTQLSHSFLQTCPQLLRNVKCVIIDEISKCSSHIFHFVNSRLRGKTGDYESNFGGLDLFACGDLKQLSPDNATPVYGATNWWQSCLMAISRLLPPGKSEAPKRHQFLVNND